MFSGGIERDEILILAIDTVPLVEINRFLYVKMVNFLPKLK